MRWPRKLGAWLLAGWLAASLCLLLWLGVQQRLWVTDLNQLLPADSQLDTAQQLAEQRNEADLNRHLVLLVGAADAQQAQAAAQSVARRWQDSGLFAQVRLQIEPDWPAWQHQTWPLRLALLPAGVVTQLQQTPEAYFRQRAEDLANPFATPSLWPPEQDWLGFGRYLTAKQGHGGQLQWDEASGMLGAEHDGRHWVMISAVLPANGGVADAQTGLLPLLAQSRADAAAQHAEVRVAGGAVFAAAAKAEGEAESRWMSAAGLGLTLLLLIAVFRRLRAVTLLLPVIGGLVLGLAACVAVFGQVHILTLVIGTSLVGVLVDLPLHWLAGSLLPQPWQPVAAMRRLRPVFALSLAVTVTGYLLLLFTPLPVLRQTAVFSAAALVGAFAITVCWLPPLFAGRPAPTAPQWVRRLSQAGLRWRPPRHLVWLAAGLLALGMVRGNWQDDIRQWVNLSSAALAEAETVAAISGIRPSGQFLLLQADSQAALLAADAAAAQRLSALPPAALDGFSALSQWLLPAATQQQLAERLGALAATPAVWADLRLLGVPDVAVRQALTDAAALPPVTVERALAHPWAEAWRPLYLGETEPGRFTALIRLHGVHQPAVVRAAVADVAAVRWVDKPARLNSLFAHTRDQALWLKLASFALAWLVLARFLGWRRGTAVLAVPLLSVAATLGLLGWLGQPVSLFAMFGLLLVAAIGVDYAVYVTTASGGEGGERLLGMLLAGATTLISFVLLAFSQTPAVAGFGLSVTLGVCCNVLLVGCLLVAPQRR